MASRACVPIDPVDPSTRTRFTALQFRSQPKWPVNDPFRPRTRTGGPRASRPPASLELFALADLDGRELELRSLQVASRLPAGEGEAVLPARRGGDDVDAERRHSRRGRMHVRLRALDLLAGVGLEVADAARGRAASIDVAIGDQQITAREARRTVHVHRSALG